MSRYKDPPEKICMVRTVKGKWIIWDGGNAEMAERLGLKGFYYDLRPETTEKPQKQPKKRKRPRKEPKTEATETSQSTEPLNTVQPEGVRPPAGTQDAGNDTSELDQFYCTACKRTVDNPRDVNGKPQCPHCLIVGKITANPELK